MFAVTASSSSLTCLVVVAACLLPLRSVHSRHLREPAPAPGLPSQVVAKRQQPPVGLPSTVAAASANQLSSLSSSNLTNPRASAAVQSANQSEAPGSGQAPPSSSIVTQSILTFVSVFFFGCAVAVTVLACKRCSDSSFRVPFSYQYSALSQFDHDPDDDVNDLEENLHMLVEDDSSSDGGDDGGQDGGRKRGGGGDEFGDDDGDDDDDVFSSAKDDAPATLDVSESTESKATLNGNGNVNGATIVASASSTSSNHNTVNGRKSISSLLDETDDEDLIK